MEANLIQTSGQDILTQSALDANAIIKQVSVIQSVMSKVMHEGEHYGKIPGCGDKPTLLKAGAEKLNFTFRLTPQFEVTETALQNGHIKIDVKCSLYSLATSQKVGEGIGSCTTLEGKFRYRTGPVEFTGKPVPKEYWDLRSTNPSKAKELLNGGTAKKNNAGVWEIAIQGEKVEHDNPADYYNTVYKMAKKRAYVDATITALAASDIFTQDVEDLVDNGVIEPKQETKQAPKQEPPKKEPAKKTETVKEEIQDAEIVEDSGKSDYAKAIEEMKHHDWNGKVYKGNVIYVNNKKFQLSESDIEKIKELKEKAA